MASIGPSNSNQLVNNKGVFSPSQWSEACNIRYNWNDLGLPCIGPSLNTAQRITALFTGIFYTPLTGPATLLRYPKIGNSCAEGFFQAFHGRQCLEDPKPYLLHILTHPDLYPDLKGQIEGQPFDLKLGFIKGQYFNDVEIMSAGIKHHPAGGWLQYVVPRIARSKEFALAIYEGNRRLNRFNDPEFIKSEKGQRLLRKYPHYLNIFKYWRKHMDSSLLNDKQVVQSIWQHYQVLTDISLRASSNNLTHRDVKLITRAIEFDKQALEAPHAGSLKANPQVTEIFRRIYPLEPVNDEEQKESVLAANEGESEHDVIHSSAIESPTIDEQTQQQKASSAMYSPRLNGTGAIEQEEDLLAMADYGAGSNTLSKSRVEDLQATPSSNKDLRQ